MTTRDVREKWALIPEFDSEIIATLPMEGSKIGFKDLAKQVNHVAKELSAKSGAKVTGNEVAGRISILREKGYVVPVLVQPVAKGKGYQVTHAGKQWAASLNGRGQ